MPSNSASEKIKRAKRHLLAAKVLLSSLPSAYWTEKETAETIDTLRENLTTTQEKIETIQPKKNARIRK